MRDGTERPGVTLRRRALEDAYWTRHAGSADPAVAVGILGQVLLMVVLGVIEFAGLSELGRDFSVTGFGEHLLVSGARNFGCAALLVSVPVDGGSILRAGVVALAHALRRVVVFPEDLEQLRE